jgi:flavin-dependent dehydrogenase
MRDVIVVGGGLAGCSAAAQLADQGFDVLLLEKGTYPRHKLCGEFLSPEAQRSFRALGVLDAVRDAGAHPITQTRVTTPSGAASTNRLPGTALGLSRYRLDRLLAERAGAAGADVRTGTRVRQIEGSLAEGFCVITPDATHTARLVLGAYGKRGTLDRTLDRPFLKASAPYVAFKAHYGGAEVPHTIELHSFPGGYCGCSHVEDGRLNVCWIARTDALKEAGGAPDVMIDRALRASPALDARLDGLTRRTERFEAVSQVPIGRKTCFAGDVCMIGDTAGMIAPLCGDGMAMALQSADLVVPRAADWLHGRTSSSAFRKAYRNAWRTTFGLRMRLGLWANAAAFHDGWDEALVRAFRYLPPLERWVIRATRGAA